MRASRRSSVANSRFCRAHNSAIAATYRPKSTRLPPPWHCGHADAGALTIAFGERDLRCLQGSSKHRSILSCEAKVDRGGCVTRLKRPRLRRGRVAQRQVARPCSTSGSNGAIASVSERRVVTRSAAG